MFSPMQTLDTRPDLAAFGLMVLVLSPVSKLPPKLKPCHPAPVLTPASTPFPPVLALGGAVRGV